jgi:hypothetical protein
VAFSMSATCALTEDNWRARRHAKPLMKPPGLESRVMVKYAA